MSRWRWGMVGILCMAAWGCQEPTLIVPVAPPGTGENRTPPPEDTPAQALGEMAKQEEELARKRAILAALPPVPPTPKGETRKTKASGVVYETLKEGTGPEVKPGMKIKVHYTGTLDDGKKFDSSHDRNAPFTFQLGNGDVIRGWDEAIIGMRVGEERRLIIPPGAGYGSRGSPPEIPPDATLHFDVELLGVE